MHWQKILMAWLLFAVVAIVSGAEVVRPLLVEIRHAPEALIAADGVKAGSGRFSFDSYDRERVLSVVAGNVLTLASREELALMQRDGLEVVVVMESPDRLTLIKRALYGEKLQLDPIYHRYDQIVRRADELAKAHPELITRLQIGETTQFRRPIYARSWSRSWKN